MRCSNHGCFRQQVRFLKRQFLQDKGLPFADVLSEQTVRYCSICTSSLTAGDSGATHKGMIRSAAKLTPFRAARAALPSSVCRLAHAGVQI